jgi:serine/threonine protein kinase
LKGYQNNHVTIGFGSYGQVKLAQDVETGLIVAVKVVTDNLNRSIK